MTAADIDPVLATADRIIRGDYDNATATTVRPQDEEALWLARIVDDPERGVSPAGLVEAFTTDVAAEVHRLKVREEAARQARLDVVTSLPETTSLAALLAEPDTEPDWRIQGWLPSGGKAMLAAQFKSGKTTLTGNLIRSLVDGTLFLDRYPVRQASRVVLIDNEMSRRTVRLWLGEQGIQNQDRVDVFTLRGQAGTFNILDPAVRARWAKMIGPADVLILDCLRPAMDALSLSEDKDGGVITAALDALQFEAGIGELFVDHHMGHNGERQRGDSRFRDWPDATWTLVRETGDNEQPTGNASRYLSALGRDVDQPETRLEFDPATRRLTIGGGTRKEVKAEGALDDVLDWLGKQDSGQSGRQIDEGLADSGHGRKAVRDALKLGIRDGLILVSDGPRRSKLHTLNPSCAPARRSAPPVRRLTQFECASALYREAHSNNAVEEPSAPPAHSTDDDEPACCPIAPAQRIGTERDTSRGNLACVKGPNVEVWPV